MEAKHLQNFLNNSRISEVFTVTIKHFRPFSADHKVKGGCVHIAICDIEWIKI